MFVSCELIHNKNACLLIWNCVGLVWPCCFASGARLGLLKRTLTSFADDFHHVFFKRIEFQQIPTDYVALVAIVGTTISVPFP